MEIFSTLILKLIPLYIIILLGFIAGKHLKAKKETLASLLIYIIAPIIIFNGVVTTKLTVSALSLPFLMFCISTFSCIVFYKLSSFLWKDTTRNILGFAAGTGNTGYFGLPVAYALFPPDVIGYVVLSILGVVLFENSVGFFITARGHHTVKESLLKVLKLPTIYAFIAGIVVNLSGISLGQIYTDTIVSFRGAYTILGMMIIGLGLSSIEKFKFDYKFIGVTFFAKFLWWPVIMFGILAIDSMFLHLYSEDIHKVLILMATVPIAANTVAIATELKAQPEKASLAVLFSTLFALFYIPLIVTLFIK